MNDDLYKKSVEEFNSLFSSVFILEINGFKPTLSSAISIKNDTEVHSEYRKGNTILTTNPIPNTKSIVLPKTGNEPKYVEFSHENPYGLYYYLNCNSDENLALNWRKDLSLFRQEQNNLASIQQNSFDHFSPFYSRPQAPTFSLKEFFDNIPPNYAINLRSIISGSLIAKMATHFHKKHDLPESTLIMIGLGVFSGLTCRRWNCAYEDGETAPICLYVVAEQDASSGKSTVLKAFQKPFVEMVEKELKKIESIILTEKENLDAHVDNEINIEKEEKARFKVQKKILEQKIVKLQNRATEVEHIMPKTNATPAAIEESLKYTNGFFIATSDEQSLLDSLISGKQSTSNELLLKGRNGERIQTARISRHGFSGKVTGSFVCFAQAGSINKIIKASGSTGLCERFLMISEPEIKKDPLKLHYDESDLFEKYNKKFSFLNPLIEKPLKPDELTTLKISNNCWYVIKIFNAKLEDLISKNPDFSHNILKSIARKSTLQIMSIASNLYLFECDEFPFENGSYIEERFVYQAIEIFELLFYHVRNYFEINGFISNKEEVRSIVNYFIDSKTGGYKRIKLNIHAIEERKNLGSGKRKLIRDTIEFLVKTNNLIKYGDGTVQLNPAVEL